MRLALQHMLVCCAGCVNLAPRLHTCMPPVVRRTASPRCSEDEQATNAVAAAVAAAAAEPEVLFPRLTDDGYSFYDDRFVSSGGSEAWLQNLKGTLGSQVLKRVGTHLAVTTLIATVVAGTFGAARQGLLPDELALLVEGTAIPLFPHSAAGSVLGLLLAFRTSQSYDRFWEARTLWDGVYSSTRSITRLACATLQDPSSEDASDAMRAEAIVGLCAAFPYSLKQHLRGERNAEELLDAAAAASSCQPRSPVMRRIKLANAAPNVPLAVLDALTRTVMPLRAKGDLLWWQIDNNVEQLLGKLANAERIKGTPVPLSYSRHQSRFFSVYAFTLPFALCSQERMSLWLLPLTVAVVSWVLFATEEIGHIIEDPFGRGLTGDPDRTNHDPNNPEEFGSVQFEVLPLGRYCADIASDVATLFRSSPQGVDIVDMPGGDDELVLFDSDS